MLKNPRNFHRSQNTSGRLSYSCFFSIKPCLVMVEMVLKTGAEMKKCAKIQPSKKMKPFSGRLNTYGPHTRQICHPWTSHFGAMYFPM